MDEATRSTDEGDGPPHERKVPQMSGIKTYEVTFDRIGRNRSVPPAKFVVDDTDEMADDLAERIYRLAKPMLASRDVEVSVDIEAGNVQIFCGWNNGGGGRIAEVTS